MSFNPSTSTRVASTSMGAFLAATAAANPGIGPDWLIPGVRPPKKDDTKVFERSWLSRCATVIDFVYLGTSSRFGFELRLPAEDFELEVVVVSTLHCDTALDLTVAGDVAAWGTGGL